MPPKDKFFTMRAGIELRDKMGEVARMAWTENLSKAIRLSVEFVLSNKDQFKYWMKTRYE